MIITNSGQQTNQVEDLTMTETPSNNVGQVGHNQITTYRQFWPFYLREHAKPENRAVHYLGTLLSFGALAAGALVNPWWFLVAPFAGYGPAWFGHFVIEKNRPATFTYPFWSLISDYRMTFRFVTGQLGKDLKAAGVR